MSSNNEKENFILPNERPADKPASADWLLRTLVDLINTTKVSFSITLDMGGHLITGELISVYRYFDQMANFIEVATRDNSVTGTEEVKSSFAGFFRKIGEMVETPSPESDESNPLPHFVHLENAKILIPGAPQIPFNTGVLWRTRVEAVKGFTIGRFDPAP